MCIGIKKRTAFPAQRLNGRFASPEKQFPCLQKGEKQRVVAFDRQRPFVLLNATGGPTQTQNPINL
jgi:hypothetical protein